MRPFLHWVSLLLLLLQPCLTLAGDTGLWPHSRSDIAPDPNAHFGQLGNGMRFVILRNALPPGQISFRLRIEVGSLQENDQQLGIAHFLEHMAFRGSRHFKDNDVFKRLERLGAAPGADSNAFTEQDETVYKIDLPRNDPVGIAEALAFLRDTAGEMSLTDASVQSERAVVLSEERLRDTPSGRLNKAEMAFLFKDQPIGNRPPIGDRAILQQANAAELRRFYQAYYRPARATLFIVGDIEPAQIEKAIRSRFADWHGVGKPGTDPPLGSPLPRGQEISSRTEAGAPTIVSVEWTQPADLRPDSKEQEAGEILNQIGVMILDQRLQDRLHGENPPFLGAKAFHQAVGKSAQLTSLALASKEEGWQIALTEALHLLDQFRRDGVRQDEIERTVTEWRAALEEAVASAATRKTSLLCDALLHSIATNEVFTTPAEDLALFDQITANLSPEKIDQAIGTAFAGNGPLIFLGGPGEFLETESVVAKAAIFSAAPAEAGRELIWPYAPSLASGSVVERSEDSDLGITFIRFANGVRLTLKPTHFHADQILLTASLGHGRQDLPLDRPSAIWAAEGGAFIGGGLQALNVAEIERVLAGKQTHLAFGLTDNAFLLSGATRPRDFATELQLMTAYLTAPGWRQEAFDAVRNRMIAAWPQWQASPSGVLQHRLGELLHGGDPRWHAADLTQLQESRLADLRAILDPVLASAPIEMVLVGDFTLEDAIQSVAATIGTLPPRAAEAAPAEASLQVHLPTGGGEPVFLHHRGREDQGIALSVWPAPDLFGDLQAPRTVRLLQLVLQQRLIDEFRTRLGGSYSPGSDIQASTDFPGFGLIMALAETPSDKMAIFDATLAKIAAGLRNQEISADEFERARKPRIESLLKSQQTNEYWLGALLRAQTDRKSLPIIRSLLPDLRKATITDLRAAAALYLRDQYLWRLRVTPQTESPSMQ